MTTRQIHATVVSAINACISGQQLGRDLFKEEWAMKIGEPRNNGLGFDQPKARSLLVAAVESKLHNDQEYGALFRDRIHISSNDKYIEKLKEKTPAEMARHITLVAIGAEEDEGSDLISS
jgi:hypothetical protein